MTQVRFFERIGSAIDRMVSPLVGRLPSTLSKQELSRMWNELVNDGGPGLADLLQKLAAETSDYADRVTPKALKEVSEGTKVWTFGGLAGAILGWILGGGSIGVVGLGMAVGIPIVVVTAILGVVVSSFGYRELLPLVQQWRASAKRAEAIQDIAEQSAAGAQDLHFLKGPREHREFLLRQLDTARRYLTLRSAFISSFAVNDEFIDKLRRALSRGVSVTMEYGYYFPGMDQTSDKAGRAQAIERLVRLQKEAKEKSWAPLRLAETLTHIKEIAIDDTQLAIGGFNWLSNASRSTKANAEKSIVIHHEHHARDVRIAAEDAANRFDPGPDA